MKPRIIFINIASTNFLVQTYGDIKIGRKVKTYKHRFLLKYLIENGYEVLNLVTGKSESSNFIKRFVRNSKKYNQYVSNFVMRRNSLCTIPVLTNYSDIRKNDIVIAFLGLSDQIDVLSHIDCYKLVFGNHFIKINEKIDFRKYKINAFVNEIDLSNNKFVNKYFGVECVDPIIVPYVYSERFKVLTKFEDRMDKAMAVGTASDVSIAPEEYKLYKQYFKTTQVQPMRFEILNHKNDISNIIDCYISYIGEDHGKQSNYTKFDMVETFNKYKIAICPEELVGMPGIGFVEAMSSGCAYIGIDHYMYKCLGLESGKHYITYDGTLNDLQAKVMEYLSKPEKLAEIAKCGTDFIRSNFNEGNVAVNFEKQLIKSYNNYLNNI